MIIKQLSKVTFDRVVKHASIEKALALESYAIKLAQNAENVLANTHAEVLNIKEQAYTDTVALLTDDNRKMLDSVETNLTALLHGINEDLYDLIYRVLSRVGIDDVGSHQIKRLLKNEFDNFHQIKKLKIIANQEIINALQTEFQFTNEACEWEVDNKLNDLECLATTHLWALRLDLVTVRTKIKQILGINEIQEIVNV